MSATVTASSAAAGRGSCAHYGPMGKPFVRSSVLIGGRVSSALRSPSCGWRMRSVEREVAQRPVVPESLAFTFSHTSRRAFQNVSSAFVLRDSSSNPRIRSFLANVTSKIVKLNPLSSCERAQRATSESTDPVMNDLSRSFLMDRTRLALTQNESGNCTYIPPPDDGHKAHTSTANTRNDRL